MLICNLSGNLIMFLMCVYYYQVNIKAENISTGANLIFLLFSRPLYIFGFSLYIMPYILKNEMLSLLRKVLTHQFFVQYAKLTYGVFLCHSMFMQYRSFNLENGIWAQVYETNMAFLANLALSFGFSFFTYLLIEAPFANLLNDFFRQKPSQLLGKAEHYQS